MPNGAQPPHPSNYPVIKGDLCQLLNSFQQYARLLKARQDPNNERLDEIHDFCSSFNGKIKKIKDGLEREKTEIEYRNRMIVFTEVIGKDFRESGFRGFFYSYCQACEEALMEKRKVSPQERDWRFQAGDIAENLADKMLKSLRGTCIQDTDLNWIAS